MQRERQRCYACFRPKEDCFCDAIPIVRNTTELLILQHRRERFHPFNTARIVSKSLQNSRLIVGVPADLAAEQLPIQAEAGLLFPGPSATLLSDLPTDRRPKQLIVLDGTWHQAKTLFRDIPALHRLPQYSLAPQAPGRYRIRREPDAKSLSTVEAVVAALRVLESDTERLNELLDCFESMVDGQLNRTPVKIAWRRNERRRQLGANIPQALTGDLNQVVVAYGESAPGGRDQRSTAKEPVYWVAQRLGREEGFSTAIQSDAPLTPTFLEHLELSRTEFAAALSPEEFCAAWAAYLRPADTLVVYHPATLRLISRIGAQTGKTLDLKSVRLGPDSCRGTLEERIAAMGLVSAPVQHPGRAGRRLALAIALVRHLNHVSVSAQLPRHAPIDG